MSLDAANSIAAIRVGDFSCYPIPDGDLLYPRAALSGNDPDRMSSFPEQVAVPYTPLLVDTGSQRILIDTGAGPMAPTTGYIEESLARVGFQASEISMVVLSHAHPDHIGGLTRTDGALRFPNARFLMSRREYDFWHSAELRSRLGSGSLYGSAHLEDVMRTWVDHYLPPVRDRLEWIADDAEIAPGIIAIEAPGHTPGHLGFTVASGAESLLYAGDLLVMSNQVAEPEWTTMFDLDAQGIIKTRRRLLDRAAADGSIVFHYHFGEAGRFARRGTQYAWERLS
jgi:glyoxylase-like metal-dependent hydrolase (beta-lactamase superfamily II)